MSTNVDIVVSSPDSTELKLVVETKLDTKNLSSAETQLKKYMLSRHCPVGLLVTPQKLWIYRDRFTSQHEDSVERLGEFDATNLFGFHQKRPPADRSSELQFELAVQSWLEDLAKGTVDTKLIKQRDKKLWDILSAHVIPAVESGVVRAAGPRMRSDLYQ